jgi:hypothetical protein
MIILGCAGVGFMAYRRKHKMALSRLTIAAFNERPPSGGLFLRA